jgi:hypothetical protein
MKQKHKQLIIKSYYCSDIDNLYAWHPNDNKVFYFLDVSIGLSTEDAADTYTIDVTYDFDAQNKLRYYFYWEYESMI